MRGSHRANTNTVQIIRTAILKKASDIRRPRSLQFRVIKIYNSDYN